MLVADEEVGVVDEGVGVVDEGVGAVFKHASELPALTVITGVEFMCVPESLITITTLVPAGIAACSQVSAVPEMVKLAMTGPSALPL